MGKLYNIHFKNTTRIELHRKDMSHTAQGAPIDD